MPKFAANISMLFTEMDFLDRIDAAADAGFKAVECHFPYAHDPHQIALRLKGCNLEMPLHNFPAGNWGREDRGIACHPTRISEFKESVELALSYASVLGTRQLNCLAGIRPPDVSTTIAEQTLLANLRYAAGRLNAAGLRLLLEPINTYDIPEFFVDNTKQALALIDQTEADNVFLQYDVYHMQRMEGELANTIRRNLHKIAHIQIADNPGRSEPGTGEINYRYLLPLLDEVGYTGWVGCEYIPKQGTVAGLCWQADVAG